MAGPWWRLPTLLLSAAVGFSAAAGAVLAVKFALDEVYHPTVPLGAVAAADTPATEPGAYIPAEDPEPVADRAAADEAYVAAEEPSTRGVEAEPLENDGELAKEAPDAGGKLVVAAIEDESESETEAEDESEAETDVETEADAESEAGAEARADAVAAAADDSDERSEPARARREARRSRVERPSRPVRRASPKRRSADARAAGSRAEAPDGPPGFVSIDARPYATIYIDGKRVGDTPLLRVKVPSGRRRIKAVTADGETRRRFVTVVPGQTEQLRLQFE